MLNKTLTSTSDRYSADLPFLSRTYVFDFRRILEISVAGVKFSVDVTYRLLRSVPDDIRKMHASLLLTLDHSNKSRKAEGKQLLLAQFAKDYIEFFR
ncbi:MAG: hypothetical protein WAJ93_19150 [Candidatus Nitrosopolaris sp.]